MAMRFESPYLLLLLVPAFAVVFYALFLERKRPAVLKFPTTIWVKKASLGVLSRLHILPRILQGIGLVLAVFALARPQVEKTVELSGGGSDIVIALDMSGSMNAVDMSPDEIMRYHGMKKEPPNRFETARDVLRRFIVSGGNNRIGLVIFSSKAWLKFPLTLDKQAMLRILDSLVLDDGVRGQDPNQCLNNCTITGEATAIGDALGRAYRRLQWSDAKSRAIILITDGDNNAGKVNPEEVAKFIAEDSKSNPVRVFTFLVGGGEYVYMPARDPFTGRVLRTPDGLMVYEKPEQDFPVNPPLLKKIAETTGGAYFEASTEKEFREEFEKLEKTEFKELGLRSYHEEFKPFVILSFLCFLLGEALSLTVFRRWP